MTITLLYPVFGQSPITQKYGENPGSYTVGCTPDGSHNGLDFGIPEARRCTLRRMGQLPGRGWTQPVKGSTQPDASLCINWTKLIHHEEPHDPQGDKG